MALLTIPKTVIRFVKTILPAILIFAFTTSISSCGKKVSHQSKRKFKSWGINNQDKNKETALLPGRAEKLQ